MPDSLTVHLAAKFDWDDASLELFKKNIFADSFCAGTWPTGRPWGSVTQLLPSTGVFGVLVYIYKRRVLVEKRMAQKH